MRARAADHVRRFSISVRVALWMIGLTIVWVLIATRAQGAFPAWVAQQVPARTTLMNTWSNGEVWLLPTFRITLGLHGSSGSAIMEERAQ